MLRLTPPSQWDIEDLKTFRPQRWEGLFDAELILKESTAREALRVYSRTRGEGKWSNLSPSVKSNEL